MIKLTIEVNSEPELRYLLDRVPSGTSWHVARTDEKGNYSGLGLIMSDLPEEDCKRIKDKDQNAS